jgi:hypothetical protein
MAMNAFDLLLSILTSPFAVLWDISLLATTLTEEEEIRKAA